MITDVSLRLIYLIVDGFLSWLIELLVLRHEVAVLGRTNPKPCLAGLGRPRTVRRADPTPPRGAAQSPLPGGGATAGSWPG